MPREPPEMSAREPKGRMGKGVGPRACGMRLRFQPSSMAKMRQHFLICVSANVRQFSAHMTKRRTGYRYLAVGARDLRRELYVTSVGCLDYAPGEAYPAGGH